MIPALVDKDEIPVVITPGDLAVGSGHDEIRDVCAVEQDLIAAAHNPAVALPVLESCKRSLLKSRMSCSSKIDYVAADPLIDILGILSIVLALLDLFEDLIGILVCLFGLKIRC